MQDLSQRMKNDESPQATHWLRQLSLSEILFALSLISIFIPLKVYPLVFVIASAVFLREVPGWLRHCWVYFLAAFSVYASASFLLTYWGIWDSFSGFNVIKLLVNFSFLYASVSWLATRQNSLLLRLVDCVLLFVFVLSLIQLYAYHHAYEFQLISGNISSGRASALYRPRLFYWGLDDKNMFGARIALLGFAYLMIPAVRHSKLSIWRVVFILVLAYLSLSRTPLVALFIGISALVFLIATRWVKIVGVIGVAAVLPFILQRFIRIDSLTSSNDGMGIRLNYWKAFIGNFTEIPVWGVGFLRSEEFMVTFADYYRGEHHLHNTFFTNYLEFGVIGLVTFVAFLICFFKFCYARQQHSWFWALMALPLFAIMMILYSGYDNDIVVYLSLVYLLGSIRFIDFKQVKIGL